MTGSPGADSLDRARRVCWALATECRADDVLIVGVGTPIAAAAAFLARSLVAPTMTIIVSGAVDPPPGDLADLLSDPPAITRRAAAVLGQADLLDLVQRGTATLQFISPAQLDPAGNVNTVRVGTGAGARRLAGCLAIPDTAALVGRLVAYRVDGSRLVTARVDHVTGLGHDEATRHRWHLPGRGVVAVIDDEGRRTLGPGGLGDRVPLEPVPADALDLLTGTVDRHDLVGLETRDGRSAARARLQEHARRTTERT